MSNFPSTITPAEVELTYDQPTIVTYSENAKSQSRIVGGHLWRLKAIFPLMTRAQMAPLFAYAASMRGRLTTFDFVSVSHSTPLGVATGAPKVYGVHLEGVTAITTYDWTPSTTGIMKAGDLIKFSNHSKVYMVTEDADSGGAPAYSTLNITPPLVNALATDVTLTVSSVPFTVQFEDDPQEWKTNRNSHSTFTADLVESL